jgi:hypothetical protein
MKKETKLKTEMKTAMLNSVKQDSCKLSRSMQSEKAEEKIKGQAT